ncbi:MAG: Phospho-N-acetylmuramoyl-pentapeptide-transferase [candidate division WS6 bacterium OLB20]|uniref:Phospho-N-acetylmuramoyl-pentapeptide-transferase n=1 Tax=candidate division WS6 bacterium OLB20 TaxID=1617426 RepID=A0A136M0T9_9BACT|nr:MAG: Phospho-N-acetylmuramoyl-pentapeptide-transferase [candidate division WS6 bacterium OLB20]
MLIQTVDVFSLATYALTAMLVTALVAFPIINILYRFRIVRHFDVDFSALIESRKEKAGTPIMGGLIFAVPVIVITVLFNLHEETAIPLFIYIMASMLGGLDDLLNIFGRARKIRSVRRIIRLIRVHKSRLVRVRMLLALPWNAYGRIIHVFESHPGKGLFGHEKLLVQVLLGILLGTWILTVPFLPAAGELWIPLVGGIWLGAAMIPFAAVAMIGMVNAVNITDGMDGLSGGILVSAFAGLLAVALFEGNEPIALLCATVVGALITYLYFNIPPARVQMGDIGSYGMGALLTVVAFALDKPLLLLAFGALFVVEFMSAFTQSIFRRLFGRRLLLMAPLHHHFEMLGWTEEKVVMRFWIFALAAALFGVWLYFV